MQERKEKYDMLSVVGPTACGKTSLAVSLALGIDGAEIDPGSADCQLTGELLFL